jgi:hypothetical protein
MPEPTDRFTLIVPSSCTCRSLGVRFRAARHPMLRFSSFARETERAPLAQLAEQLALNQRVRGSSPWRRTPRAQVNIHVGLRFLVFAASMPTVHCGLPPIRESLESPWPVRGMIIAVLSAASRATSVSTLAHVSLVTLTDECRSISCTIFTSTPAATSRCPGAGHAARSDARGFASICPSQNVTTCLICQQEGAAPMRYQSCSMRSKMSESVSRCHSGMSAQSAT